MKLLDFGYLDQIEGWGSDERIVEAARMSTGKGFLGWGEEDECARCKGKGECARWGDSDSYDDSPIACPACHATGRAINEPGDEKLLRYLYENRHDTPFEMAGLVIEVQAPIFVFREWHRHRTQSYNEMSGRYTPLPDINYVPTIERLMLGSDGKNKQAGTIKGAGVLTEAGAQEFRDALVNSYASAELLYQTALASGVPKELARVHLPVGRYSRMRASANLRNWLAFLTLRTAPAAQWEIRQYADGVATFIAERFPRTYELFCERRAK